MKVVMSMLVYVFMYVLGANYRSARSRDFTCAILSSKDCLSNLEMGARSFDDKIAQVKSRDRADR